MGDEIELKAISRHGVGFDNVDLNYIKKNNISLLITATANAVAVAEHVISMFLSLSKSISKYDEEVRKGNFKLNADKIQRFLNTYKPIKKKFYGTGNSSQKILKILQKNNFWKIPTQKFFSDIDLS